MTDRYKGRSEQGLAVILVDRERGKMGGEYGRLGGRAGGLVGGRRVGGRVGAGDPEVGGSGLTGRPI